MRILTFSILPPCDGGGGKGIYEILKRLSKSNSIDVITYSHLDRSSNNLKIYDFNLTTYTSTIRGIKYIIFATIKGFKLALINDYDLIYAKSIFSPGVPAAVISLLFKKPLVIHTSGLDVAPDYSKMEYNYNVFYKIFSRLAKWFVLLNTNFVIANAENDRLSLKNKYPTLNIRTIRNGVDTKKYNLNPKMSDKIREELSLKKEDIVVIYTGTNHKRKNLNKIIELSNKFQTIKFLFVGPTKLELELLGKINNNCIALGHVNNPEVYLQTADIFMLLSSWEGTSNSLLEAMSSGLPIIVSPAGDSSLVVKNRINGFVIEKYEELETSLKLLVKDSQLRKEMGKNNRRFILDNGDWDKCASQIERVFHEVVKK